MREASCPCGQLTLQCDGEPVRVSVCHCRACQRRSGSAFAVQARWPEAQVTVQGDWHTWSRLGESGNTATFRFCPACGTTVAFTSTYMPGFIAVPVGTFADPGFPPPGISVYEESMHSWVSIANDAMEHFP
jgi:hypothetical protein